MNARQRVAASYRNVAGRTICDGEVARTVEVRPDLLVDLDRDGRALGVERIDGRVCAADLAEVIQKMWWLGRDVDVAEEWGVLEQKPGGPQFTTLANCEQNDDVDRGRWARALAKEVGGVVQRRVVIHAVGDWETVDG